MVSLQKVPLQGSTTASPSPSRQLVVKASPARQGTRNADEPVDLGGFPNIMDMFQKYVGQKCGCAMV